MTVFSVVRSITDFLSENGIPDPETDARLITEHVCGIDHTGYYFEKQKEISENNLKKIHALAAQRALGMPLQYILGSWSFCGLVFSVGEGVLIPRPETEELVEITLDRMKEMKSPVVFDLCSGTGCIGISIKHFRPDAAVYLIENSSEALRYIEVNKVKNGFGDSVVSVGYDVFNGPPSFLPGPDVLVSNPPYIPSNELSSLQKEVKFEPKSALDGGADGLDFYRLMSEKWIGWLNPGGFIAVECGEHQADRIKQLFGSDSNIIKDFYGTDRFVIKRVQ